MDPTNQLDKMRKNQYQESKDITSNILLKKKYRGLHLFYVGIYIIHHKVQKKIFAK